MNSRSEFDLPQAIREWGWRFHHLGSPTDDKKADEIFLEQYKFSVSGFNDSPFGIEWMRFESECEMPEIIQSLPHIAFVVDDLEFELTAKVFNILVSSNSPIEKQLCTFFTKLYLEYSDRFNESGFYRSY